MKIYFKGAAFYALACLFCAALAWAADAPKPAAEKGVESAAVFSLGELKKERDKKMSLFKQIQEKGQVEQKTLQQLQEAGIKTVGQIEQLNAMIQKLEAPSDEKLKEAGVVPEKK